MMTIFFTSKQPSSVKCEQGIGEGTVSFKNSLEKDTENTQHCLKKREIKVIAYYPGNSITHSAFIATGDQWYQAPVCQHLVKNIPPARREVQQIWKQLQVSHLSTEVRIK